MASRFVRIEIVKAGAGSSATGLSAYIARDARLDQSGTPFNFAHRADELEAKGLILPADASEWAADAAQIWRAAERAEQTIDRQTGELRWKKNGQIAKHMTIALPREATPEQREAMLLEFVAREINPQKHGVVVEWAIHREENNPHAHLLISTRALAGSGFGKKARTMNPEFASKGDKHFIGEAENWDNRWAAFQCDYFERLGIVANIRERRAVPEEHYTRGQLLNEQVIADRAEIARANESAAQARWRDPAEILEHLTAHKSIFTARDVRQALTKSGLEGDQREALEAAILGHEDVVTLVADRREGRGGDEIGWTTRQVREEEQAILSTAARIGAGARRAGMDERPDRGAGRDGEDDGRLFSARPLGRAGQRILAEAGLSDEQRVAAERITDGRQLSIVIGRAGTGKSHSLNAARLAFEAEGFRVIGLAPTNSVAGNLRKEGYSHAATLHRELGQVERDPKRWDRKTVVIVDEAAMMDNRIMLRLLQGIEQSGARLVLAGDDRQFASVSRGGMFPELVNLHGAAELTTVYRQRQDYQAKASADFARGDVLAALQAYDSRGQIVWCDSLADARQRAVEAQTGIEGLGFLYASTNREVEALNRAEQQRRRANLADKGEVIQAHGFETIRGEVSIAAGERMQFYETNRQIGVATSEFGTVKAVAPHRLEIVKDDGTVVGFDPKHYDKWGLGYAGTGYKGQGKTQPRTAAVYDHAYAWDARAAYVIGTRHREDYRLFVPRDMAPDLDALTRQITRQREDKGSSLRFQTVENRSTRQEMQRATPGGRLEAALAEGRQRLATAKAAEMAAERLRQEKASKKRRDLSRNRGHGLGR